MSFICHIHNYTECNEEWNVFSAFNPSKWSSRQPTLQRPGSSWGFGALPKGLTSDVDTSCQSRDSNPQPWVTSGFKSNALSIRRAHPGYNLNSCRERINKQNVNCNFQSTDPLPQMSTSESQWKQLDTWPGYFSQTVLYCEFGQITYFFTYKRKAAL